MANTSFRSLMMAFRAMVKVLHFGEPAMPAPAGTLLNKYHAQAHEYEQGLRLQSSAGNYQAITELQSLLTEMAASLHAFSSPASFANCAERGEKHLRAGDALCRLKAFITTYKSLFKDDFQSLLLESTAALETFLYKIGTWCRQEDTNALRHLITPDWLEIENDWKNVCERLLQARVRLHAEFETQHAALSAQG